MSKMRPDSKPQFIAIVEPGEDQVGPQLISANTKKDLVRMLEDGGYESPIIIRGRVLPSAKVTRIRF